MLLRSLLPLSVLLLLLAACTGQGQAEQPTPQPSASPQVVAPPPQLVLTLWHTWNGRRSQALNLLARRYEQDHPEIRIILRSHSATTLVRDYSASVDDGSAPQLLLVRSRYVGDLAARRHILPLDGQFASASLQDLLPAALDGARAAGRLHGVPLSYDSLMLFYDRRKLPQPPTTLEQLLALSPPPGDQQTDRPLGLAYYLSAATTLPYLRAFEGEIFDSDGSVALDGERRDGALRWLEWLQTLRADSRAIATDDFSKVDALIQSNRIAAAIDWSQRLPAYERVWGSDALALAALPRVDDQSAVPSPWVLADVVCINVVTSAQQRAAAADFLRYLISVPAQELLWTRGGQMPVNQRANVEGRAKDALAASARGVAFPNTATDTRAWPLLDEMVRSVLAGSATPAEALDTAAAGLRALEPRP